MLETLARTLASVSGAHPIRVAIDGVDAAGKTTLADELVSPVRALGRTVIRASVDDFHNPREIRYRLGRDSAEGYFLDSFDLASITSKLLEPLGPGGSRRFQRRAFDYRIDAPVDSPWEEAEPDALLLFDGIFLQRHELRDHFELTIFVDAPFEVTVARMVARNGSDPHVDHPSNRRYLDGQRLYLARCSPRERADIVVDNRDLGHPRIVCDEVSSPNPLPRSLP